MKQSETLKKPSVITFSIEKWADFSRDADYIFPLHYEELSLDNGKIPMGIDNAKYQEMESVGRLHVLVARSEGQVVGYYIAIIVNHPHYKDAGLHSTTDMFYLLPEYRIGNNGMRLLAEAEQSLRKRGVVKAFIGTKLKQDHSKILEWLGWTPTDTVFTKVLA
jgi:hypothetical protein